MGEVKYLRTPLDLTVMFRAAVVDGIQGKPADPQAAGRAQSLLRQLNIVIRQAVEAQLVRAAAQNKV